MESKIADFHFKEFSELDNSDNADYLINSMDVMYSLESIQRIKQTAITAMNLQLGDRVLEIGCGHGEDAEAIAQLVGDSGSVLAVDISQRMIEEAKKRSKQTNVEYIVGDVCRLPCPDHSFSACYADRFLVGQDDMRTTFNRILRYVKPGGILCFTDVDALSIVFAPYNKTTQIILDELHQSFINPYAGRLVPQLFIEHGLKDITVLPEVSMIRSFDTLCKIFKFSSLAERAVTKGLLSPLAVSEWFREMHTAEAKENFLYCVTFLTTLGRAPL